jgi:hypothetical protein
MTILKIKYKRSSSYRHTQADSTNSSFDWTYDGNTLEGERFVILSSQYHGQGQWNLSIAIILMDNGFIHFYQFMIIYFYQVMIIYV